MSASPSASAFPYTPFSNGAGPGPSSQRQFGMTPQQQQAQRTFQSMTKPPQSSERLDAGEESDDESSSEDSLSGEETAGLPTRTNSMSSGLERRFSAGYSQPHQGQYSLKRARDRELS